MVNVGVLILEVEAEAFLLTYFGYHLQRELYFTETRGM